MVKEGIRILKKLKFAYKDDKNAILLFTFLCLFMTFISIFSPALISKIVYSIIELDYKKTIFVLLIMGTIKLINLLINLLSNKIFYKIRKNFIFSLKSSIAKKILNFDIKRFSQDGKGKYIQRINNDPEKIAINIEEIKNSLMILTTNIGAIFLVLYINMYIGLTYIIFTFLIICLKQYGINKRIKYKKEVYLEQEKINEEMSEIFNGIKDVKQLNMKESISEKNNKFFKSIESLNEKADYSYTLYDKLSLVIEWVGTIIILFLVMFYYKTGTIKADDVLGIFLYKRYIFSISDNVAVFLNKLSDFNLSCNRILELISVKDNNYNENDLPKCLGKIEFKNLNFSYDSVCVLKECSFLINSNQKVLIVGESGSGKTTILNLITKMYNVENNTIFIDDKDINEISEDFIRQNISIISQYYYLFDMSIKDNFYLLRKDIKEKDIIKVCKMVGIHDFIMSLPNQYDTIIGSGGYNLSGGQRQRIAIARTLILNTKIILFDEVTSSLDTNLESLILKLINKLEGEHTIIVVSHNSRIFKDFNKIIVLNKNHKIEDIGDHNYLLKNSRIYKKLYIDENRGK